MLDTQKLLYILPDLAYLAEFLPGKQPHTFTVASFKQFNGRLMTDGKLMLDNLTKLIERVQEKLETGELDVVLADEMFTNTMINVEKKTEAEVKEHLQEEVIPSLHIDLDSHQIETFILSEYKGVYKVQLATIQHSALAPLKLAFEDKKIKLNKIYPLSWTVKSLISLEPSISMLQMGKNLFMAKHYIGVDQPLTDTVDNLDRFVEAIKTLKGSESSMQTVYLVSDAEVEEELKKKLEGIMPIQQLVQEAGQDKDLPAHVEKAMTTAMRTITIDELETPQFTLSAVKLTDEMKASVQASAQSTPALETVELEETQDEATDEVTSAATASEAEVLPKPGEKAASQEDKIDEAQTSTEAKSLTAETEVEDDKPTEDKTEESTKETDDNPVTDETNETLADSATDNIRSYQPAAAAASLATAAQDKSELAESKEETTKTVAPVGETQEKEIAVAEPEPVDLKKFAIQQDNQTSASGAVLKPAKSMKKTQPLKNDDGTSNLLRVILIGVGSFALTVAIGVGIGFGVLKLSQPQQIETPEVSETVAEEEPTPEPEPTPVPDAERENYSIRVVNATTKAGYAGQIAAILEEKEYKAVNAKNAVDDYEPGNYLLMAELDEVLLKTLSNDLELELVFVEDASTEDPRGEFDAVVVLAQ